MRVLVFFDLPVETSRQRSEYAKFRRSLIKDGYLMKQESVYSKLVLNPQTAKLAINRIKTNLPKEGLVQALIVTEKQFASIQTLLGEDYSRVELSTTDRLVIV
ncbi:MAG: CRISPR-associated endonuclease Cas2 [Spirochaetales bacterium]|nr:CRISPR-associated endonuclease Cas2 [Spirochaetales bacterium]